MLSKLTGRINNNTLSRNLAVIFTITLIAVYSLIILVNITLGIQSDEDEAVYLSNQTSRQAVDYIETKCENTLSILSSYAINETLQSLILTPETHYEHQHDLWQADKNEVNKILARSMSYSDIDDFFLFFDGGLSAIGQETNDFTTTANIQDSPWFIDSTNSKSLNNWYSYDIKSGDSQYLSAVRKILSPQNLNLHIGYIQAKIRKSIFVDILENAKMTDDTKSVIINTDNDIVLSTVNYDINTSHLVESINNRTDFNSTVPEIGMKITLDNNIYLVNVLNIEMTDWYYIQLVPYNSIRTMSLRTQKQLSYSTLISIPFFIIAFFLFQRSTSKKIHNVIGQLDAIGHQYIDDDFNSLNSRDDFENLNYSLNMMIKRIDKLKDDRYDMGMEIKSLEIKTLQAQINPHFLYNSLNILSNIGIKNNIPEIPIMINNLSNFYKLGLSKGRDIITVESEIEIAKSYMAIQNMRFNDCAKFLVDIPHNLLHYNTPKLILQPFVENALWHGILESEKKTGIILLTVYEQDDSIVFEIKDNGRGMSQNELDTILVKPETDSLHGYGVKNVYDRLCILYDKAFSIDYTSKIKKGTTVSMKIPKLK